ncbi:hypothetical protein PVAG01_05942 [Phlyctema vagabunda]|uniref:Uncharacterized protein n=1 Tax=Phlyctema vagabunda TaxID=108571 RepID=A0ABR4PEN2_9HELO
MASSSKYHAGNYKTDNEQSSNNGGSSSSNHGRYFQHPFSAFLRMNPVEEAGAEAETEVEASPSLKDKNASMEDPKDHAPANTRTVPAESKTSRWLLPQRQYPYGSELAPLRQDGAGDREQGPVTLPSLANQGLLNLRFGVSVDGVQLAPIDPLRQWQGTDLLPIVPGLQATPRHGVQLAPFDARRQYANSGRASTQIPGISFPEPAPALPSAYYFCKSCQRVEILDGVVPAPLLQELRSRNFRDGSWELDGRCGIIGGGDGIGARTISGCPFRVLTWSFSPEDHSGP